MSGIQKNMMKRTKGSEKSVGSMGCSSGWDQNIIGIRVYKES